MRRNGTMKWSLIVGTAVLAGAVQAQPYGPGPAYGYGYGAPPAEARPYYYGMPAPAAAEEQSPALLLRDGMNKLIGYLKQDPRPANDQVAKFLSDEIAPYFDFAYMARWAAGGMYRHMGEEQRDKLQGKLRDMFLAAMAERLAAYNSQEVVFLPPRGSQRGEEVTLPVAIRNAQGYPAELDFRFYRAKDGWKVFDVVANGSSALAYYRDYFRTTLRGPQGPMGPGRFAPPGY
jgi:phospholipid transport system substrate-binding protein